MASGIISLTTYFEYIKKHWILTKVCPSKTASLCNATVLGYTVIQTISIFIHIATEEHWRDWHHYLYSCTGTLTVHIKRMIMKSGSVNVISNLGIFISKVPTANNFKKEYKISKPFCILVTYEYITYTRCDQKILVILDFFSKYLFIHQ